MRARACVRVYTAYGLYVHFSFFVYVLLLQIYWYQATNVRWADTNDNLIAGIREVRFKPELNRKGHVTTRHRDMISRGSVHLCGVHITETGRFSDAKIKVKMKRKDGSDAEDEDVTDGEAPEEGSEQEEEAPQRGRGRKRKPPPKKKAPPKIKKKNQAKNHDVPATSTLEEVLKLVDIELLQPNAITDQEARERATDAEADDKQYGRLDDATKEVARRDIGKGRRFKGADRKLKMNREQLLQQQQLRDSKAIRRKNHAAWVDRELKRLQKEKE